MFAGVFAIHNTLTSDSDNDGIPDTNDKCPNTLERVFVDQNGCSQKEFCNQFSCGDPCDLADWRNDEKSPTPNDCQTIVEDHEGKLSPKCIPREDMCLKNVTITLPTDPISFKVIFQGKSYWNTTLSKVPSGFGEIHNGSYLGWCVERDVHIEQNKLHNTTLISSYDPDLALKCPRAASDNWDLVNYLLNHKQGTKEQIQDAIWYLLGKAPLPQSSVSRAMINDSITNGQGFIPQIGDNFAVIICVDDPTVQLTFIEIDP